MSELWQAATDDWRDAYGEEEAKLSNLQEPPNALWRCVRCCVWGVLALWCVAGGLLGAVALVALMQWGWRQMSALLAGAGVG